MGTNVRLIDPATGLPYRAGAGASAGQVVTGTSSNPAYSGALLYNGTTWDPATKPSATFRILSAAASTNASSVKASAGDLFHITGYNANAAARYLKFYNKASAPTVGTDVPVWTEYLAPQAKFHVSFPPRFFSLGIALALTTGGADADTGALTAGDILALNVGYV